VHGGRLFEQPVMVNDFILDALEKLIPLAPLHQPHNLAAIRVFQQHYPTTPHIACFDTAFHTTQSELARRFALPPSFAKEGIERYGFHGLSYEYIAQVLPQYLKTHADGKVIVAHLGNGASLCAMEHRQSVATSMGFTTLDGLMMGSRCGTMDAGVVLYLLDEKGMDSQGVARLLYDQSGLKGVSGISHDMRVLLASPEAAAAEAVDLFVYQLVKHIGAMIAVLGGVEAIIFTAGIGEHCAPIRARACDSLRWLGITLDAEANARHQSRISADDSRIGVYVIPTDEERMMALHGVELISNH
jgi:acetate kinase